MLVLCTSAQRKLSIEFKNQRINVRESNRSIHSPRQWVDAKWKAKNHFHTDANRFFPAIWHRVSICTGWPHRKPHMPWSLWNYLVKMIVVALVCWDAFCCYCCCVDGASLQTATWFIFYGNQKVAYFFLFLTSMLCKPQNLYIVLRSPATPILSLSLTRCLFVSLADAVASPPLLALSCSVIHYVESAFWFARSNFCCGFGHKNRHLFNREHERNARNDI